MTKFAVLLNSSAHELEETLYYIDPAQLDHSDFVAALCNAFRHINALQKQVQQLQSIQSTINQ